MSPSAREYLQHILDETTYIKKSSTGLDKTTFIQDETLKRAYVRSIEVIGEAVKQLPDGLRQKYDAIEWRAIAGMRDRLIHNYYSGRDRLLLAAIAFWISNVAIVRAKCRVQSLEFQVQRSKFRVLRAEF